MGKASRSTSCAFVITASSSWPLSERTVALTEASANNQSTVASARFSKELVDGYDPDIRNKIKSFYVCCLKL